MKSMPSTRFLRSSHIICVALRPRTGLRRFTCSSSRVTASEDDALPRPAREFKVTLDNGTLYVPEELAQALGWKPELDVDGLPLTLSGWAPNYFAIARTGSDSDLLARGTVESSRNPRVKQVLDYLKDR